MNHIALMDGQVGDRFRKVKRPFRDIVIGALLAHLEASVGTDKTLDFIDDAETFAARFDARQKA